MDRLRHVLSRCLSRVAPPGSRRRDLLSRWRDTLRRITFLAPVPDVPELRDLLDPDALAALGVILPAGEPQGDPDAVLHLYDHEPRVRRLFPLGLTPAQLPALLVWLLGVRQRVGLPEDDVLAFYVRQALDPARGLAATYRRQPGWQRAVPGGLTRQGWPALLAWLRHRYRPGAWMDEARLDAWDEPQKRGVNLLGHFRYPSGLQTAAFSALAALSSAGFDVSVRDVPVSRTTDVPGREGCLGLHPYPITVATMAPQPFAEDCYERSGLAANAQTYRIGYWSWELDDLPDACHRRAGWLNEVWAPTSFIGDAFRRSLSLPVFDVLPGLEIPTTHPLPRSSFGLRDDRYLFLFCFDGNSTFARKNPFAVVEAFRRAFSPDEPAALAIKVARGHADPFALERLTELCRSAGVTLIDRMLTRKQAWGLMNACDAYVSLHRAEGLGLTLAEAMALGKPVIATGYSGNLDYMSVSNSLLVAHRLVGVDDPTRVYPRGFRWAEPSVECAAAQMRWAFENQRQARVLGQQAALDVRRTLSMEAAGRRMAVRIEELLDAQKARRPGH
jgi:glycosyltransferase involved in cell wall biosynthesis